MILDVGCGVNPRGDVNTDRFIKPVSRCDGEISAKKVKNFVLADGQNLPFKDATFEKVISYLSIAHVENPFKFLKELIRVSNAEIEVTEGHRLWYKRTPYHKSAVNIKWFEKALALLRDQITGYYITCEYGGFPHPMLTIVSFPRTIHVRIWK